MSEMPVCPCDVFQHPTLIVNPPGQPTLAYRVGDYTAFRHALLQAPAPATGLPTETELMLWRPHAKGDLALQMVEWWAYLADILTFYTERAANEAYLNTAALPESVQRLIRLLGYRPRPGIGATGLLAALVSGHTAFTLSQGFQIQSKPGPGKQPQIFEVDTDTLLQPQDTLAADPPPVTALVGTDASGNPIGVLVKGTVTLKPGDQLLLLEQSGTGHDPNYQVVTVATSTPEKAPCGKTNTRVQFKETVSLPADAQATGYQLLTSAQFAHVWQYPADHVIQGSQVDLEAITRGIKVGDPVLFDFPDTPSAAHLGSVMKYTEVVWYANPHGYPANPNPDPSQPPVPPGDGSNPIPIPIPHTRLTFTQALSLGDDASTRQRVVVRYAWRPVGDLIATPAPQADSANGTLHPASGGNGATPPPFPSLPPGQPILVEDALGSGALGLVDTGDTLHLTAPVPSLTPPLRALFNTFPVSRGQMVRNEVLGSGDASASNQEFILQKSPLTYLLDPASASGDNYTSTLRVWVNGIAWQEARSFYGQPPDAHIFVTREDEENKTHVLFGDGVHGARLTTGVNNVVVSYRYGSGKDVPAAGTLTTILQPVPHLKEIRNPVAVGGGADPDPPAQIRRYAPRSVLTFGRAVSADDYETIAAQTPGVARARSYWTFDAEEQRALVTIYVGDDASAVTAARTALAGASDPNRPVVVKAATPIPVTLSLALAIDQTSVTSQVIAATRVALLDPDTGLFGAHVIRIGQVLFRSAIYAVCLGIPGVLAVHALVFLALAGGMNADATGSRYDPHEGGFFQLQDEGLVISPEAPANAG
jgi:hypothetical protein